MTTMAIAGSSPIRWPTPPVRDIFQSCFSFPAFASLRVRNAPLDGSNQARNLDDVLHEAQTIVRNKHNILGAEASRAALVRLSDIINGENWDEGYALPTRQSVETLFNAIGSIRMQFTSLSIATGGQLKATWIDGCKTVTAVGRDDKTVAWSKVEETDDGFETETSEGPISEFLCNFGN